VLRAVAVFFGVFALVLAILLAAVGQLGRVDRQTFAAVLASAAVAGGVAALGSRRRQR
jgi:hypothetical protein